VATITELRTALTQKRLAHDRAKSEWIRAEQRVKGLRAGDDWKLYKVKPDASPEAVKARDHKKLELARAAKAVKAAERRLDEAELRAAGPARPNGSAIEGKASVYPADGEGAKRFLLDLRAAATTMDSAAIERLNRNQRVALGGQTRDSGPVEAAGFTGPAWLGELFATAVRPGPSVASSLVQIPWEAGRGYEAHIPKVTVGASVGVVEADNPTADVVDDSSSIASETADSKLGVISGALVVDLAVYERSDPSGALVWLKELYAATDAEREWAFLNDAASTGQGHLDGLRSVSGVQTANYTDGSPTPAAFVAALAAAKAQFAETRLQPATHVYMHPRRWEWVANAVGTSLPLLGSLGGQASAPAPDAPVGVLSGLRVVTSTQIPTDLGVGSDEDVVILAKADDIYWSESRRYLVFRQGVESGRLAARVESVAYLRLFANRYPTSILVLSGTGLANNGL
jgi:hypothetical protein